MSVTVWTSDGADAWATTSRSVDEAVEMVLDVLDPAEVTAIETPTRVIQGSELGDLLSRPEPEDPDPVEPEPGFDVWVMSPTGRWAAVSGGGLPSSEAARAADMWRERLLGSGRVVVLPEGTGPPRA